MSDSSDPVHLSDGKRWFLAVGAVLLFAVGVIALLCRRQDGLATMSILLGAMALFLMALIGQFPGSAWLKVEAQAIRFQNLTDQISADAVFRSVADVAAMENAQVKYWAKLDRPFFWPAIVSSQSGRDVAIAYLNAGDALPGVIPPMVWEPPGPPASNILIIHDANVDYDQVWFDLRALTEKYGYGLVDDAAPGQSGEGGANIAIGGSTFIEIHRYLTALLRDEFGGTGNPITRVGVLSLPQASNRE